MGRKNELRLAKLLEVPNDDALNHGSVHWLPQKPAALPSKNLVPVPLEELGTRTIVAAFRYPNFSPFERVVVLAIVEILLQATADPHFVVGRDGDVAPIEQGMHV
jgi:hypothetical protein